MLEKEKPIKHPIGNKMNINLILRTKNGNDFLFF